MKIRWKKRGMKWTKWQNVDAVTAVGWIRSLGREKRR
jgi:hypothetical protein